MLFRSSGEAAGRLRGRHKRSRARNSRQVVKSISGGFHCSRPPRRGRVGKGTNPTLVTIAEVGHLVLLWRPKPAALPANHVVSAVALLKLDRPADLGLCDRRRLRCRYDRAGRPHRWRSRGCRWGIERKRELIRRKRPWHEAPHRAPACLRWLPFANVGTAVHVQHLPGDVRSFGQINHGIHDLLNGRNASHWG